MNATLFKRPIDRGAIARASAAIAPVHASRSIIDHALREVDLTVVLHDAIPREELCVGDVLMLNKTIVPREGDSVALLYSGGKTDVVNYYEYQRVPKMGLNLAAVLIGYFRPVGRA